MSTLSEYCIPFVKKGGYFIPYKSGKADEEIEQAKSAVKKLRRRTERSDRKSSSGDRCGTHLCPGQEDGSHCKEISEKGGTSGEGTVEVTIIDKKQALILIYTGPALCFYLWQECFT